MQSDRHERISERAYRIWVTEGRVHGKDHEHWQRAEREIAGEELKAASALAKRATGAAATKQPRQPRQATGAKKAGTTAAAKSTASASTTARRGAKKPAGSSTA